MTEYTHNQWSTYTHDELADATHYELSGPPGRPIAMALKPFNVSSIIINPGVVTTGSSVMISIVIEENDHDMWSEYTHEELASRTHDDMNGMYQWDDWESSTWADVSNLIWGA